MMKAYMQRKIDLINQQLTEIYTENMALNKDLAKAMNYSLMAGGKRLRPILIMAAADALGVDGEKFLRLATSIEFIHTYSLIHDDLPAMDNDDYRRGKLTNHKVFGEALAILAGDALLTMAFEIIATDKNVDADTKVKIIAEMSKAAGAEGMVGGQVIDMQSENKQIDMQTLKQMHAAKTGALFCAAIRSGAILAGANDVQLANLTEYARQFGLAFQITDDMLDVVGDEKTIGKPVGSDEKNHKSTYVTLGSLESAKALAQEAVNKAKVALEGFGENAEFLRALVDYLITRNK
ncbi:polyprenyl synthetase family protein [uncultured Megamonas sp.]|uniref:polyprenyl synthetase family protein n=1 Tax=uncultured Megamonas sp. TaxID=286140 RepID=UPI00266F215B|nr:farnesyl diphosphate synthase [uncultured Megamonas sp.]